MHRELVMKEVLACVTYTATISASSLSPPTHPINRVHIVESQQRYSGKGLISRAAYKNDYGWSLGSTLHLKKVVINNIM